MRTATYIATIIILTIALGLVIGVVSGATTYYCDPVDGNTTDNNGLSPSTAWGTLESVFATSANKIERDSTGDYAVDNAAAPVEAGDTIECMVGDHGELYWGDVGRPFYVVGGTLYLKPYQNEDPCLALVYVHGFANIDFNGFTVDNSLDDANGFGFYFGSASGESNDVTVQNCVMRCAPNTIADNWTETDWLNLASYAGIQYDGQTLTATGNTIYNQGYGIVLNGGNHNCTIDDNHIFRFAADGIRVSTCNDLTVTNNFVRNFIGIDEGDVHGDLFQAFASGYIDRLNFSYNQMYCKDGNSHPYPSPGKCQAMAFSTIVPRDGTIKNNVIITSNANGIGIGSSASNMDVINNTCVRHYDSAIYPASSTGGASCYVANNIYDTITSQSGVEANNIDVNGEYADLFVDWENNDFQLVSDSNAVDAGTDVNSPADDVIGNTRDASPDIGAYEYAYDPVGTPTPQVIMVLIGG